VKKCERMLLLFTLFMDGIQVRTASLAAKLGVTPRSIQRDIEHMRSFGVPINRVDCKYSLDREALHEWRRSKTRGFAGFMPENRFAESGEMSSEAHR